jgi:hypothetical protein
MGQIGGHIDTYTSTAMFRTQAEATQFVQYAHANGWTTDGPHESADFGWTVNFTVLGDVV